MEQRPIVGDVGLDAVVRVAPTATLRDCAAVLSSRRCGTLIVDSVPPREVCDGDIVEAIARGADGDASLLAVAGRAPDFVRPDMLIEDVAALMLATDRSSVVVVVEGEPVGVLRWPAVIGALFGGSSWIGALRIALHIERPLP